MALQLSPYFKAISRQPHMCPECGHRLVLKPLELTWDGAVWKCERCKWFQTELAPDSAKMGQREPAKPKARIISVDFTKGASK